MSRADLRPSASEGRRSCRGPVAFVVDRKEEFDAAVYGRPQQGRGPDRRGGGRCPPQDMATQDQYGVTYHRYWFNPETGRVFCLVEAPNKEAAERVHREAHGLVADELIEVQEG